MLFLYMLFCHCIADFILQTKFIARAKSIEYWKNNKNAKSKYEFISVLIVHSFMWALCIHFPIILLLQYNETMLFSSIIINTIFHFIIDHLKCNMHLIDLNQDQTFHLIQIALTRLMFF